MDKKKNIKRVISLVCMVALVILLAAMPLLAKQEREEDGPKASILSGIVTTGSISAELIGGGTLTEEKAVAISVPSAVKLTKFLVSNGDAVTEGTPIAKVDRVSVMTAISRVQETLEYLSEEIEDASDINTNENVNALAGGIVKILYAEKGDSVPSVMLEHGALAVLSLDGLMGVDFETESNLSAGTAVTVTLSDGKEVSGKIAKNLAGEMTVTLEDDNYPVGDTVTVTSEGSEIGSGELYIYSPWNATAYTGTVDTIRASVGDQMNPGKTLMVLKDVGHSAVYYQLIAQRQEYEDLMLDLFKMYQTETVDAPCDGVVSGIDVVAVNGTVISLVEMDGTMPEMNFPEGEMPERPEGKEHPEGMTFPENGERPDFAGENGGRMPGFGNVAEDMETKDIDISKAHISVEADGVKESGSLENIAPGTIVTVTLNGKGEVTYVLITSQFGFGGRPPRENNA